MLFTHPEHGYSISLPAGWRCEPDPDGDGTEIYDPLGAGILHLLPLPGSAAEEDPGEELYAFLAEQDVELEEDEVEDMELPDGGILSYCEFETEEHEEGDEGTVHWLVGIAAAGGGMLLASYSAPRGDDDELEEVRRMLATLTLRPSGPPPAPDA